MKKVELKLVLKPRLECSMEPSSPLSRESVVEFVDAGILSNAFAE